MKETGAKEIVQKSLFDEVFLAKINFLFLHVTVAQFVKREILSLKKNRQINYLSNLVISLVKPLFSRNFCHKSERGRQREFLQFPHSHTFLSFDNNFVKLRCF